MVSLSIVQFDYLLAEFKNKNCAIIVPALYYVHPHSCVCVDGSRSLSRWMRGWRTSPIFEGGKGFKVRPWHCVEGGSGGDDGGGSNAMLVMVVVVVRGGIS